MNKEKQIEEIKKVISDICPFYKEYNSCEQCNDIADIDDEPCYWECMAKGIIRYGYRKADEVAREIFEEIGELVNEYLDGRIYTHDFCTNIAELKKKYIGEDTNVTTNTEGKK